MNTRMRRIVAAPVVVAATLGLATLAYALWSDNGSVDIPAVAVGAVSFDGHGQKVSEVPTYAADTTEPQYSSHGESVALTLPAKEILKVLEQTGLDPDPVIWRFTVEGYAQGIAGMNVTVSMGDQIGEDGTATSLDSGNARQGTILAMSTLKVYPASLGGDCSNVPETPAGEDKNIYLFDANDHLLQSPGAYDADHPVTSQVWCVAMDFNQAQDATYANEVQAIGTGEDGTTVHAAIARWDATVAFPPSLDPLGIYRNRVDVVGTAEDGTLSRANTNWDAMIYPDPDVEPDVTIILTPTVTNLNSGYIPS